MFNREEILKKAREHFKKSSLNKRCLKKCLKPLLLDNDPEAILLLNLISTNKSEEKQILQSFKIAKKAAESGFPPAISHLAELYYNNGYKENAYSLYHKAADLQEAHALKVLSIAYKFGLDGLDKNIELSNKYEECFLKAKKWNVLNGYNDEFLMYE
ncbi:hypothetical protein [Acinetobacter guillouiae]|uniref:hypothetical protein n=1 Tax=Acinetobacter guillouiae TaxID=106649 RepID=UPI001AE1D164|nr:hypothetical protein [Acinetobacter guillouiae]MBP2545582.1 TPR repeat protein [Acinetobacter guillouiae]